VIVISCPVDYLSLIYYFYVWPHHFVNMMLNFHNVNTDLQSITPRANMRLIKSHLGNEVLMFGHIRS